MATSSHRRSAGELERGSAEMIEDFHVILGVRPAASAAEIRHAYLELAKEYHPDRNPNDPLAAEKFKQVHRAFEKLYKPWRWRFGGVVHTPESVFDEPESVPDEAASGPQRGWSRHPYPIRLLGMVILSFLVVLIGGVVVIWLIADKLAQESGVAAEESTDGGTCGGRGRLGEEATHVDLGDWTKKELTVDFGVGVKLEMVLIPAGEFLMGTTGNSGEKPVHEVTITQPFYLGKYEVTQEQWEAVMGNNPEPVQGAEESRGAGSVGTTARYFFDKLNAKAGGQGRQVRIADRGAVGICLPGGEHGEVLLWRRRGSTWTSMRGMARTRATRRIRWARRSRTPGGCTTCTGTCGSGARTGTMAGTMRSRRRTIRPDLRTGSVRVLRGGSWYLATAGTAGRRTASTLARCPLQRPGLACLPSSGGQVSEP